MTRDETKKILTEIACLFPRFAVEGENKKLKVDLWTEALKDAAYDDIHGSLIKYSQSSNRGFAPTAGELIDLTIPFTDPLFPDDHVYMEWEE